MQINRDRATILNLHYVFQKELHGLILDQDILLREYKEYQRYFIDRSPSRADDEFYSYMLDELSIPYFEAGKYHLEHRSLKQRMKENRVKRNDLSKLIKAKKVEINAFQRLTSTNQKEMQDNPLYRHLLANLSPEYKINITGVYLLFMFGKTGLFFFHLERDGEFNITNLSRVIKECLQLKYDTMYDEAHITLWKKLVKDIQIQMRKVAIQEINDTE
jgi:hypothetical protein